MRTALKRLLAAARTVSEVVGSAIRVLLRNNEKQRRLPSLPSFKSGGQLVDIADRDALYEAMEGR